MITYIKALRTYVEYRPTSIAQFTEPIDPTTSTSVSNIKSISHSTTLADIDEPTTQSASGEYQSNDFVLTTKYGLSVLLRDSKLHLSLTGPKQSLDGPNTLAPPEVSPHDPPNLRLGPSFNTNHLWYVGYEDDFHVDIERIETICPQLAPYWLDWSEVWDDSFKNQECHLGSGKEVFVHRIEEVAWNVEGLLMACWMVLIGAAKSISYEGSYQRYLIEKQGMDELVGRFFDKSF